ncbi:MAG: hypothetical protein Q8K58_03025 [Acidimicrobiales bacterium]|nr:hypothetical protein [Acidimicrobiales bacterium]
MGLVALAVPQLVTGAWAVFDPAGWFQDFPGFGPALVGADPPYNAHLATDAGAGFLATGVLLVLAALWGRPREVVLALVTHLVFSTPHLVFHVRNPAPGLTSSEDAQNVATLAIAVALPVLLFWGNREQPPEVAVADG